MDGLLGYSPQVLSALGLNPDDLRRQQQQAGLLSAGLQLLAGSGYSPVRQTTGQLIGQAGMAGLQGMQQAEQTAIDRALRGMQVQQLTERQRQEQAGREAMRGLYERMSGVTPQGALAAPGGQVGPTPERAAMIGQRQPISAQDILAMATNPDIPEAARKNLIDAAQLLTPKPQETFSILTPEQKAQFGLPKEIAYQISSTGKISQVGQGPLVQNIVGGEKGFKYELELKNNFKAEPVYKAYQEMKAAYGQVTESLKKGTPAGDLAGATKFMKLLDPGSVVRESELYLAMSASGALDRFTNYANMVVTGQKLTPTQRADFQGLADRLFADSANAYNSKRNEYLQIGNAYDLNAERALGSVAKPPAITQRETAPTPLAREIPTVRQTMETSKAPAGVRQELWDVMTPDQKKLWLR